MALFLPLLEQYQRKPAKTDILHRIKFPNIIQKCQGFNKKSFVISRTRKISKKMKKRKAIDASTKKTDILEVSDKYLKVIMIKMPQ